MPAGPVNGGGVLVHVPLDAHRALALLAPGPAPSAPLALELVGADIDGISDDAWLSVGRMQVLINRRQTKGAADPGCCPLIDTRC